MVCGPGVVGIAQSHAILGIGPDLLDLFGGDDDKSDLHHPRPGSEAPPSGQAARTVGVTTADAGPPVSTFGSGPQAAGLVAAGGVPKSASLQSASPQSASRGGGGGAVSARQPGRPVIEPAVCAFCPDYPQYRHPGDSVSALCGHGRAAVCAARHSTDARRRPAGRAASGRTAAGGSARA